MAETTGGQVRIARAKARPIVSIDPPFPSAPPVAVRITDMLGEEILVLEWR